MLNFITMRSGVFDTCIREIVFTRLLFFIFFVCGNFRQASAETAAPISTLNTSYGESLLKSEKHSLVRPNCI